MQYTLTINQIKAKEWGLNLSQANVFAFVYTCSSWCRTVTVERGTFYALSKQKIVDELPLVTEKPDTAFRILKQLEKVGVLELSSTRQITLVRLTAKGRTWGNTYKNGSGADKSPYQPNEGEAGTIGKNAYGAGKKIQAGGDNFPTNQTTSLSCSEAHALSDDAHSLEKAACPTAWPNKFSMYREWQPDAHQLRMEFVRRGMDRHSLWTAPDRADFTAYYADVPGMQRSAAGWTTQFAKWVQSNRRHEQQLEQTRLHCQNRQAVHRKSNASKGNRHAYAHRNAAMSHYDPAAARARARAKATGTVYEG